MPEWENTIELDADIETTQLTKAEFVAQVAGVCETLRQITRIGAWDDYEGEFAPLISVFENIVILATKGDATDNPLAVDDDDVGLARASLESLREHMPLLRAFVEWSPRQANHPLIDKAMQLATKAFPKLKTTFATNADISLQNKATLDQIEDKVNQLLAKSPN